MSRGPFRNSRLHLPHDRLKLNQEIVNRPLDTKNVRRRSSIERSVVDETKTRKTLTAPQPQAERVFRTPDQISPRDDLARFSALIHARNKRNIKPQIVIRPLDTQKSKILNRPLDTPKKMLSDLEVKNYKATFEHKKKPKRKKLNLSRKIVNGAGVL